MIIAVVVMVVVFVVVRRNRYNGWGLEVTCGGDCDSDRVDW